jgi:ABC-type multidrug transport system ATPase subunit
MLKDLAKDEKKNIMFTIHQPSAEIYDLFDRLLLLKNGKVVY